MQQNKSGMKSNTYSATTTGSARQSSESTGRNREYMGTLGSLLPTPQASDQYNANTKNGHDLKKGYLRDIEGWKRSTSSQVDSHASRSPMQAKGGEKVIIAICGQRCLRSFGYSSPPGSSLKMFTESLVLSRAWSSSRSALTWKRKATRFGRSLFQLVPSTFPTEGIGCGLSPTPQASDWVEGARTREDSRQVCIGRELNRMLPTPESKNIIGYQVSGGKRYPRLGEILPSPQARDWKGKSIKRDRVPDSIENHGNSTGSKLRLQPAFVEWMMGYPKGWTKFRKRSTG